MAVSPANGGQVPLQAPPAALWQAVADFPAQLRRYPFNMDANSSVRQEWLGV